MRGFSSIVALGFGVLFAGLPGAARAVAPDSTGHRVRIVQAEAILRDPSIPGAQRLVGNVVLAHRDATLKCDSAWRYDDGRFRAMGKVQALRPQGWSLEAEELTWNPEAELLLAAGPPAHLIDGELSVSGPELWYDWAEEAAWFRQRTTLVMEDRVATADRGRFESASEWLVLGGSVEVEGAEERVVSDSLKLHARAGDLEFLGTSRVDQSDGQWAVRCERGVISESGGWVGGHLLRAWVRRGGEGVWADSLAWTDDVREAWGHVEALDTALTQVVRGRHLRQERVDSAWVSRVVGEARLIQANEGDTLVLVADELVEAEGQLRAFPNVVFRQGEALGMCGALIWSEEVDHLRMLQDPRLWLEGQILSADTLDLHLSEGAPDRLYGEGHVHLTRVINDSCADQISGRTLTGQFRDGDLDRLLIEGNGEAIYFVDDDAELQFNRAACSRLRIRLEDGRVKEIALLDAPNGRFLALNASLPTDRWLEGTVLHEAPSIPGTAPWPPELPR